jgi:hypothetical protein
MPHMVSNCRAMSSEGMFEPPGKCAPLNGAFYVMRSATRCRNLVLPRKGLTVLSLLIGAIYTALLCFLHARMQCGCKLTASILPGL